MSEQKIDEVNIQRAIDNVYNLIVDGLQIDGSSNLRNNIEFHIKQGLKGYHTI